MEVGGLCLLPEVRKVGNAFLDWDKPIVSNGSTVEYLYYRSESFHAKVRLPGTPTLSPGAD